ncbi:BON domain-containing protein [Actinokineospora sp. HUAS TT18]|uniref:BON domain-containing protein n=1 Tax=Actinokineospora sp. HUAS TT18 TaxID=3447451 RepID=UPI003F51E18E
MSEQTPQYQVAAVRRALAEDERTAELGVRVTVHGDTILLSGDVECDHRRDEIDAVVHDLAPTMRVLNDIRVTEVGAPKGQEELR